MKRACLISDKKEEVVKISMLRCWVTAIKDGYIVMRPLLKAPIGLKGSSITYSTKKNSLEVFSVKDELSAFNIHQVGGGWRAKKVKSYQAKRGKN